MHFLVPDVKCFSNCMPCYAFIMCNKTLPGLCVAVNNMCGVCIDVVRYCLGMQ